MSKAIKKLYWIVAICMFILIAFLVFPPIMFWNAPIFWGKLPSSEVFLFVDCVLQCVVMIIGIVVENSINKKELSMRKRGEPIEY